MATHSSIFAWRIAWTEKPSRLPSMVSQRVGHDSSDLAHHIFYSPLHCTQSRPVERTRAGFASAFASWGRSAGLSFLCHPRWGWEESRATGLGFDGAALACSLAPSSGASKFQPPLCIWDPPGDPWGNPPLDIGVFWTEKTTTVQYTKQNSSSWGEDDSKMICLFWAKSNERQQLTVFPHPCQWWWNTRGPLGRGGHVCLEIPVGVPS